MASGEVVFDVDYPSGVCAYNKYLPAEVKLKQGDKEPNVHKLSRMQINLGEHLVKKGRILVGDKKIAINPGYNTYDVFGCDFDFLGYKVYLSDDGDKTGKFANVLDELKRVWDYSNADEQGNLWNGYARRYINGYVRQFTQQDIDEIDHSDKYTHILEDKPTKEDIGNIKTWDYLACDDKYPIPNDKDSFDWIGQKALAVLKGDVDNLGAIFQQGIYGNCFAKMVSVSRLINNFFAVYLPYLCETKYPNSYTVFAGGDDFFLVGGWKTIMELSAKMAQEFKKYVADNNKLHFSAGVCMFKPGIPIKAIANMAEDALEIAKSNDKNSISIFNIPSKWVDYSDLLEESYNLKLLDSHLSTGYIYGLLKLCDMSASTKPQDAIWHSYFSYRTHRRYGDEKKFGDLAQNLHKQIGGNIKTYTNQYKITLMHYLYQFRE